MKNIIKKASALIGVAVLAALFSATAFAQSTVTYEGGANKFIFAPGSRYSPTDLFPGFKSVMPGDSLTEKITVKNDASGQVKVRLYIRSLAAEEGSEEFLSRLRLRVSQSGASGATKLFDAAADQTGSLTDWVYLGTLYSGGETDLDVTLEVPVTLGNEFKDAIGYLDWQFKAEELPSEPDDPKPPKTGDESGIALYAALAGASALVLTLLAFSRHRTAKKKQPE